MKRLSVLFVVIVAMLVSSCAHKSHFEVAESDNGRHIFQYCGGKQWGFSRKLGADEKSPYLLVFLESEFREQADLVMATVLIHTISDTDLKIKGEELKIQRDGKPVTVDDPNFWLIHDQPDIYDQFDYNKFEATQISPTEWSVGKIKHWGMFGRSSIEDPVIVKLERAPNEPLKSESTHITLDPKKSRSLFFERKVVIKFDELRPAGSQIWFMYPRIKK
jgi:hypothetical protein